MSNFAYKIKFARNLAKKNFWIGSDSDYGALPFWRIYLLHELEKKLEYLRARIERELRVLLYNDEKFAETLYEMIYYHLGWAGGKGLSGKMLRSIFGILCCEIAQGDIEKALPAVSAVELLHNFSLIHDDIQDDASKRRGRETVWVKWGMAQAINTGDALFTIARNALLKIEKKTNAQLTLDSLWLMDEACMALCKGQFLDLSYEKCPCVDIDSFLRMVKLKTGSLWGLAGQLGVLVGTQNREKAEIFKKIGENIGIIFQIQDDILGIWGQTKITGKNGNDLQKHKKNMPIVHALSQNISHSERISQLYQKKDISIQDISQIKQVLEDAGSKKFCLDMAADYAREAKSILRKEQQNSQLESMIDFLLQRLVETGE